jgi:outer membrane lipoprotein-sorting protein
MVAASGGADTWYAASIVSSGSGAIVTHTWSKGRKFRAESVLAGRRLVTIVNDKYYYALDPVAGRGLKVTRSPKALEDDAEGGRPFGREWRELEAGGAEHIDSEELGGMVVDTYQLTDTRGRRRVWVTQSEPRLPYRIEIYDRRTTSSNVTDYSGWQRGLKIADSFFEPDSNVELEEMSYEAYRNRATSGDRTRAPILYRKLLHGSREQE